MKAYIINLQGKRISEIVTTPRGIKRLRDKIKLTKNRKSSNVLKTIFERKSKYLVINVMKKNTK